MAENNIEIGQLELGKVDGKHEYFSPKSHRSKGIFDAFLLPSNIFPEKLNNSDRYFIEGFRGTGKTSFLRWHSREQGKKSNFTKFILFKSDLTESQRLSLSSEIGIDWSDFDPNKMEISQDFKSAWTWFILHKIGEVIKENENTTITDPSSYLKLLGLGEQNVFTKTIGFMPKLEGANVRIKADISFFEVELGGDFKKEKSEGKVSLDALCQAALRNLKKLSFKNEIFIYFDELEVFYSSEEQYRRDQRLVRDLIFSISKLNDIFCENENNIHLIGAVRSEVVNNMGSLAQEVDRIVHDRGFKITWHNATKSIEHPLIQMISRKILSSEGMDINTSSTEEALYRYFPEKVGSEDLATFILDKSFYKPRDIVWRLSIAQKMFPNETKFTHDILKSTETEYSTKLWDEVKYELSAAYSSEEISVMENIFTGGSMYFELHEITDKFENYARNSPVAHTLLKQRSVSEILSDLYRLGAIGNVFRVGTSGSDIRHRWSFRGDPTLVSEKRMQLHPALAKRLAFVPPRRRGSHGSRVRVVQA